MEDVRRGRLVHVQDESQTGLDGDFHGPVEEFEPFGSQGKRGDKLLQETPAQVQAHMGEPKPRHPLELGRLEASFHCPPLGFIQRARTLEREKEMAEIDAFGKDLMNNVFSAGVYRAIATLRTR